MRALDSAALPSSWRSYAGIFWCRRAGLRDLTAMPRIERTLHATSLDAAWLAAYRTCVGLPADSHAELPPLALQIAAAPLHLAILADPQFPFKALGLVHVAQSVVQTERIAPQQPVTLRAYTTSAQQAHRGTQFGLVTEALVDGRIVWRAETTALVKNTAPNPDSTRTPRPGNPSDNAAAEPGWDQLAIVDVPEPLGRRYAAIAGDLNPIHQHALLARPFGFPRAIIHGTWTLARGLAAAALPSTAGYSLEAQFRKPVSLPSTIAISIRREAQCDALRINSSDGSINHVNIRITHKEQV